MSSRRTSRQIGAVGRTIGLVALLAGLPLGAPVARAGGAPEDWRLTSQWFDLFSIPEPKAAATMMQAGLDPDTCLRMIKLNDRNDSKGEGYHHVAFLGGREGYIMRMVALREDDHGQCAAEAKRIKEALEPRPSPAPTSRPDAGDENETAAPATTDTQSPLPLPTTDDLAPDEVDANEVPVDHYSGALHTLGYFLHRLFLRDSQSVVSIRKILLTILADYARAYLETAAALRLDCRPAFLPAGLEVTGMGEHPQEIAIMLHMTKGQTLNADGRLLRLLVERAAPQLLPEADGVISLTVTAEGEEPGVGRYSVKDIRRTLQPKIEIPSAIGRLIDARVCR